LKDLITYLFRENPQLTLTIIGLHALGYTEDLYLRDGYLYAVEIGQEFYLKGTMVRQWSVLTGCKEGKCYYVYSVETDTGVKGVFISEHFVEGSNNA